MPRIRAIDPHFPQTASLSRSREARLFFILLWTLADDSGRKESPASPESGALSGA